jgi:hypothetical protein
MTDHLSGDHLPEDAPWLIPTEAQCGHGYIGETGEDAIVSALQCEGTGPVNIAMRPEFAIQWAAAVSAQCMRLRRLQHSGNINTPVEGDAE